MLEFLQEYFINPILANGWFNPVNTIVYSIILIIAVFYVFKLLRKLNVRIDNHFIYAILPFIFWGSSTRVLHDAAYSGILSPELNAFYGSPIFPTPGSYIITFSLALGVLLVSLLIQRYRKFPYWKSMFTIGVILSAVNIILLPLTNLIPFLLIAGGTLLWFLLFISPRFLLERFSPKRPLTKKTSKFLSYENTGIIAAHFLDATATVVALVMFGYVEQHVVPRLLFPFFGAYAMFLLKAVVVPPVLYIIDRYAEEGEFKKFLKAVILILGLAPGLRNLIRLMVGV
jgi:uncharacterized membrane protein